jgi:3'-phosphoadenosine 5'-phosphosulfate sulfotransferase (PAPS reductase)/FAD synthetase
VKVVFTNTGREMDQTLDFVQECSERWNVPIVWLEYDIVETKNSFKIVNHNSASRNGEPFEKLIERYGRLPNALQRFCTGVLKLQTASKYLKSFGWKYWHNALGIRSDEKHRTKEGLINGWYFGFYPLVDAGVSLDQINNFWKKQPFDLKLPVVKGKSLKGNCDCCFLKSEHILAMMFREHPEKAKWWIDIESKYKKKFNRDRGLVDFSNYINNQQDWVFNQQGYFCQADGGECTG